MLIVDSGTDTWTTEGTQGNSVDSTQGSWGSDPSYIVTKTAETVPCVDDDDAKEEQSVHIWKPQEYWCLKDPRPIQPKLVTRINQRVRSSERGMGVKNFRKVRL